MSQTDYSAQIHLHFTVINTDVQGGHGCSFGVEKHAGAVNDRFRAELRWGDGQII